MPRKIFSRDKAISVLLPALNEENNLQPTVERLQQALNITMDNYEIIIINDGSSDRTGEVADYLAKEFDNIKVAHNKTCQGLGKVYVQGVALATKPYFVYIPSDNTWPYRSFLELFGNLSKADVITSFSSNPGVRPFGRRVVSKGFTRTMNLLFGLKMNYFNGLTIYPIEFLQKNPITTGGFGFQAEALIKALNTGYSFIELGLPIDERSAGSSKAVNIKNIFSVAYTIFKIYSSVKLKREWENGGRTQIDAAHSTKFSADETGFMVADHELPRTLADTEKCNIVITGASSGIGAALMKSLAADGHTLFICARNAEKLQEVTHSSALAQYMVCDVSKEAEVQKFAEFVADKVKRVDVLINCAGKFGSIGNVEVAKADEWIDTLKVNLFGPFITIQKFLPLLKMSTRPQIINFSGGGSFSPFPNFSAYSCSKAAVVRLTETLAIELLPYGITVNAVAPGIIATPAHEAVITAGEELAGKAQYNRAVRLLQEGGASMTKVIDCIRMLLTNKMFGLTGKTISANFDPWATKAFQDNIADITRSDLYTLCRMNIVNLPEGRLRDEMAEAWAKHETKQ